MQRNFQASKHQHARKQIDKLAETLARKQRKTDRPKQDARTEYTILNDNSCRTFEIGDTTSYALNVDRLWQEYLAEVDAQSQGMTKKTAPARKTGKRKRRQEITLPNAAPEGLTHTRITENEISTNTDDTIYNDFKHMSEKGRLKRQNNAYANHQEKCSTMHQFYQNHCSKTCEQTARHMSYDAFSKAISVTTMNMLVWYIHYMHTKMTLKKSSKNVLWLDKYSTWCDGRQTICCVVTSHC